jgi:hypothetical protein
MSNCGPIYCIGDSHVNFFSGQNEVQQLWPKPSNDVLPYFKTFRLGAILAYNLCKYGTRKKGRELLFVLLDRNVPIQNREIPPESKLLLCFGEIDCRAHLLKQAEIQKRDITAVVEECVKRYFSVISEIKELGYETLVWNVIPTSRHDHIPNREFPVYGTCLERNHVTRLFNNCLSDICSSTGVEFISIFDELVDEQGLTREEYYFDYIHLSQKAMPLVIEKVKEIFGDLDALRNSDKVESCGENMFRFKLSRSLPHFLNFKIK